jgi:hypothetical protein
MVDLLSTQQLVVLRLHSNPLQRLYWSEEQTQIVNPVHSLSVQVVNLKNTQLEVLNASSFCVFSSLKKLQVSSPTLHSIASAGLKCFRELEIVDIGETAGDELNFPPDV